MGNVRDEMVNDSACGKKKRVESSSLSRCGFRSVCYFGSKNMLQTLFGAKNSVRGLEFRGVRFAEVANVLQVWDFKFVTRTLSALGSVSASWSVC